MHELHGTAIMKIRAHLALIVTATLIPVIIFSTVALTLLMDAERNAALKNLHETARSTALMIDRELGSAEAALRVLGNSDRLASGDLAGFYMQMKAVNQGPGTWLILLDRDGRQVINTLQPFGAAVPAGIAPPQIAVVTGFGRPMVSDLMRDPLTSRYLTTINVPVPIDGGQRYVLAQAFAEDYFRRIFLHNRIPDSWTVAILDRKGTFIARSKKPEIMTGRPARPELALASAQSPDGELRHRTWEGTDSYDVFTRSELSGWTVAVAVPAAMVDSAAQRAVLVAALGLLAALLAAIGTAAIVSRRLIGSIRGAEVAAAALASGAVTASAPLHTGVDEMDKLANAFTDAGAILLQEKQSRLGAEAERARLLENERIGRQQAEQQIKAKDQFLAMLGHELRNPLSAISGAIAVMKARDASAALNVRAHTIIERQSNHLSRIVDDLLDLSRMSMGKITLDRQSLDLAAVVAASIDTLYAAGRVGQCDIGLEAEPVWIDADRTRLDQIIGNVLGNALKFSSMQGRIDVNVCRDEDSAVWTVRDFGIGIAKELMPHIFDAFVHGAAQTNHALGGLGIGLNLVRQLVELHAGTIKVWSAGTGSGTTVEIRFPLSATSTSVAVMRRHATMGAPQPAMSTVLLIEDNADSREMMSMLLGMLGYQVLEAANGSEGLALARRDHPAIAVVDIGLPDMDGYEVARQLREDASLRGMTLIALTGYGQDADRKRALVAGFDSHLVKPLDMDVLVNTIVSHQSRQNRHSQDAGPGA